MNISTKLIKRINIEVEYYYSESVDSSIQMLRKPDGSYDESALVEYEEFIINALEVFDRNDFEVIEEAESDRSKSMYFSLVKKSDFESNNYKYILFIRLSDHRVSDRSKTDRKKYYAEQADRLKTPKDKRKQAWKLKDIVVNGETFESYDEALNEIDKRISS